MWHPILVRLNLVKPSSRWASHLIVISIIRLVESLSLCKYELGEHPAHAGDNTRLG